MSQGNEYSFYNPVKFLKNPIWNYLGVSIRPSFLDIEINPGASRSEYKGSRDDPVAVLGWLVEWPGHLWCMQQFDRLAKAGAIV